LGRLELIRPISSVCSAQPNSPPALSTRVPPVTTPRGPSASCSIATALRRVQLTSRARPPASCSLVPRSHQYLYDWWTLYAEHLVTTAQTASFAGDDGLRSTTAKPRAMRGCCCSYPDLRARKSGSESCRTWYINSWPRLPAPPVYPQALHQIFHSRDLRIGRAIAEKPGRGADPWQCSTIGTVILWGTSGARGTKTEVFATQFCRLGDRSAANFSPLAHHRCSAWSDSVSAPTVGKNFTQSRATTELAKYLFNCRAGASGARVFAGRPWCHRGGPSCPPTEAIGGRSVASHRSENRRSGLDRGCEGILSVDLKLKGIDPIRAALRVD
jgi:hypothetical protein